MCAGMSVWKPLRSNGVQSGQRVGIVGIGGLGHLAILMAAKMGAEVVAFSTSEDKRTDAMSLGASEFWLLKDLKEKKPDKPLDHLVVSADHLPDWSV
jgi:D-arabinose 1-dehydrogenase-like Zn-dependent alcohol dehydrogenase